MQRRSQASSKISSTSGGVTMIIELELRQEIARALKGEVSLNDFYSWLMARSWNMHKNSESSAVELAGDVEEIFFERADGRLDDRAVRHALSLLLNNVVIEAALVDNHNFAPVVQHGEASQSVAEIMNAYASHVGYQIRFLKPQAVQLHSHRQQPWNLQYA
jgi:hypothetical protein